MLLDNPRFQKEYKEFSEKISRITEESVKVELNKLLQSLVNEVKNVDRKHQDLIMGGKLTSDVMGDHRNSIISIRQQITKKIQSYEKAGLIKG